MVRNVGDRCGRYELVRPLGRGGAGVVWEATLHGPSGFRKAVALKLLRADSRTDDARASLRHEARLGALVSHPNVASTLELGELDDGAIFVAMELVRGLTVHDLARRAPLPASAVLEIGIQTCAGLRHLHGLRVDGAATGLVHRDIKPSNLLVDGFGCLKIADLGIAAVGGQAATPVGTPGFAAPEQILEQPLDGRTDLFALGATLFLLASRKRLIPRGQYSVPAVLEERLANGALFDEVDRSLPGLGAVLRRAVQLSPDDRYPHAAAFAAALSALQARQTPGHSLLDLMAQLLPGGSEGSSALTTPMASALPTVMYRGLPRPPDRFFGREGILGRVLAMVREETPLLVLHGPGGMGKTRLSLEVAHRLVTELPGGAWFFDLSEATSVDALCTTVARALGLALGRTDPLERVGHALRARGRALFVFDNLEQMAEPALAALSRLGLLAPEARFLCTSRLGLGGGAVVEVGPLELDEAVALFEDRAARRPVPEERPAVERIVAAIDRMPLAIELCATRTRWLGLADLERRLSERLALVAGAGRERPARHRSVRAALDGSWELLRPDARRALAQLSVFEGGFTVASAEAVLDVDGWALDLLQELADASLVMYDEEAQRFSLLRLVQDHAAEHLPAEARAAAEERHGRYLGQLGSREALAAILGHGGAALFADLAAELDNLVVGATRAAARGDGPTAVDAGFAAWSILKRIGPYRRAQALLEAVLAVAGDRRAHVRYQLADLHAQLGDFDRTAALISEATAEASGDPALLAKLADLRAHCLGLQGHYKEALEAFVSGRADARSRGDFDREAMLVGELGMLQLHLGRPREAEPNLHWALRWFRRNGNRVQEGRVHNELGRLRAGQGRPEEALEHYRAALASARESGLPGHEAHYRSSLGGAYIQLGRVDEAERMLLAAIETHSRQGDRRGELVARANLAVAMGAWSRIEEAREQLRHGLAVSRELGLRREEGKILYNIGHYDLVEQKLSDAERHMEGALAVYRELDDLTSQAIARAGLAAAALDGGDLDRAEHHVTEGLEVAQASGQLRAVAACLQAAAELAHRRGDLATARAHLTEAIDKFAATHVHGLIDALTSMVRLEVAAGDPAAAARALAQAEEVVGGLAAPGEAVEATLAEARAVLEGPP